VCITIILVFIVTHLVRNALPGLGNIKQKCVDCKTKQKHKRALKKKANKVKVAKKESEKSEESEFKIQSYRGSDFER
jgi:hypothetical protein